MKLWCKNLMDLGDVILFLRSASLLCFQVHIESGHGETNSPTSKDSVDFFSKQENEYGNDSKLCASISEPVPIGNDRGKLGIAVCTLISIS